MEVIYTDLATIGGRVWAIRSNENLSRRAFAERLGCQQIEIENIEYNKLKKPEQKESLYRNIATTFGVSLEWIKTGRGDMYGVEPRDQLAMAYGSLSARHDPVVDGFIQFLADRTPEQLDFIYQQLKECVEAIETMQKRSGG